MVNSKVHSLERTRRCGGLRAVAVVAQALQGGWRSQATAINPAGSSAPDLRYRLALRARHEPPTIAKKFTPMGMYYSRLSCRCGSSSTMLTVFRFHFQAVDSLQVTFPLNFALRRVRTLFPFD